MTRISSKPSAVPARKPTAFAVEPAFPVLSPDETTASRTPAATARVRDGLVLRAVVKNFPHGKTHTDERRAR